MTWPPDDPEPPVDHRGVAPVWDCGACTQPWPCERAKEALLAEFHNVPSSLMVYMSAHLMAAMTDLSTADGLPPPDLWRRFVGWVRPAATGLALPTIEWPQG